MAAPEFHQPRAPADLKQAPAWVISIFVLGAAGFCALFVEAVTAADTELLQGLTIAPILVALTVPIALRLARKDHDPSIAGIVLAAIVAKLIAAWVRYWVAFEYYDGRSDALQYHEVGRILAPDYRRLDFTADVGEFIGTGFVKALTGGVYAMFGTSRVAGFFVFAWIGFLGLLLLARAFAVGVPTGDARRYLIAVLFIPSSLYWPSAIGKEAWMMLALGLSAFGLANLFRGRSIGIAPLAGGLVATMLVRPHLGLILFVGLVFATLVRRAPARDYAAPLFRVIALGALLVAGVVIIGQTSAFVEDALQTQDASITEQLESTSERTYDGGSAFSPVRVDTPIDLFPATATVFFRPLPFEASSPQELASAAEGALLIFLLVASRKRLRSIPRLMRTTPYVTFCVGYLLAFVYAFSSFANFGILARQRSQAIPFLLVFLALPKYQDLIAPSDPEPAQSETGPASTGASRPPQATGGIRRARRVGATHAVASATHARGPGPHQEGTRRRRRPEGQGASRRRAREPVSTNASVAPPPRSKR